MLEHDSCSLDHAEFGPLFGEVSFALPSDVALVHTGRVAVLVVEHSNHIHANAIDDGKRSKALRVKRGRIVSSLGETTKRISAVCKKTRKLAEWINDRN